MHSICQKVTDSLYYLVYGYELAPTAENLSWALQQNNQDVVKYQFKDKYHTYSILEFAIKCNDLAAVHHLVNLEVDLNYSQASSGMGNMLHFYMDCLEELNPPNLQILSLLLGSGLDVNETEVGCDRTPLECALVQMSHFKKIHWEVVELLFQHGATVTEGHDPFYYLKKSVTISYDRILRNFDSEKRHLDHLIRYLELEKKYCTRLDNFLTLKEFIFYTANFQNFFSMSAISLDASSVCNIDPFTTGFNDGKIEKEAQVEGITKEEIEIFKQTVQKYQNDFHQKMQAICEGVDQALLSYYHYFSKLVKNGSFKECFKEIQLEALLRALNKYPSVHSRVISLMFKV